MTAEVRIAAEVAVVSPKNERMLSGGWEMVRVAPDAIGGPSQLAKFEHEFRGAIVPGTVAMVSSDGDLDAWDHWYRCRFEATPNERTHRALLCFDGLATLADVWLNGRLLGSSENMFESHTFEVTEQLLAENELAIRFRALLPVLNARRPRGRFPTRLVSEKNLRFVRTTLLGYIDGFGPPIRPVGPWRAVRLVTHAQFAVEDVHLRARLEGVGSAGDGSTGVLEASITCQFHGARVRTLSAVLDAGDGLARAPLTIERDDRGAYALRGRVVLDRVRAWWPFTHGEPALYPVFVDLAYSDESGEKHARVALGRVGFRSLELVSNETFGFALRVNGEVLFARGACWTPLDFASLHATEAAYRTALDAVRACGMNMLRVSGTMVYESDIFYRLCDELGIMVWQDFMFARMDYPTDDPTFLASCGREVSMLLDRIHARPSLAMLCGNSEVSQQAAMMGMSNEVSKSLLFDQLFPSLVARTAPEVPYIPSTPSGGAMPFFTASGVTHYFGVGAYLRPLDDARLHRVRFAAECLAFSNVPEEPSLRAWLGDTDAPAHHPRYKERVPRDPGAGWDFADVTDHYVEELFGVDVRKLRYADHDRYLALCRAATCEVMSRVQGFWRAKNSTCRGSLIWHLRDVWEGSGWGVIDAGGAPKSGYYGLKRAWSPIALWIVDEGLDGLVVHAENETAEMVSAVLELELYRADGAAVERARTAVTLAVREQKIFPVEGLIGRFVDSSYAYRFGPPGHVLVVARLRRPDLTDDGVFAQAFALPLGHGRVAQEDVGLSVTAVLLSHGAYAVRAVADKFAHFVSIESPGYSPTDNYFHLAPRVPWCFELRPMAGVPVGSLRGKARALNSTRSISIRVD